MIRLFEFSPAFGLPSASPFCLKLETYLRMANIPYEPLYRIDPRRSPKGKFPFIKDGEAHYSDSVLIIDYLEKKYQVKLDDHLSAEEKAYQTALRCMIEEHLYWAMVYTRWFDEKNWHLIKKTFFGMVSPIVGEVAAFITRRKFKHYLHAQGIGRHSSEEIIQLALMDLEALNTLLSQHDFLLGNQPSTVDASGYGFLANILIPPLDSPLRAYLQERPVFAAYCERIRERFFD